MTDIISFGTAIVAHEQGKTVQFYNPKYGYVDFDIKHNDFSANKLSETKWRIKPKPVKYSIDIWMNKTPKIDVACTNFANTLLGSPIIYNSTKTDICNKKVTITVECE